MRNPLVYVVWIMAALIVMSFVGGLPAYLAQGSLVLLIKFALATAAFLFLPWLVRRINLTTNEEENALVSKDAVAVAIRSRGLLIACAIFAGLIFVA